MAAATLGKFEHHRAQRVVGRGAVTPDVGPVRLASARLEHGHWRLVSVQHRATQHFELERIHQRLQLHATLAHPGRQCRSGYRKPGTPEDRWLSSQLARGMNAKQFRRLKRVVKRQRTILGVVMREIQRKMLSPDFAPESPKAVSDLMMWLERAERIRTQHRHDKNKLFALHALEVECIGKGKARKPYEFGVKSAVLVSHQHGLMVGARTFPGNPYDGHILSAVLEQATNLMQDLGVKLKCVVVDLGFRGVDADNPDKLIILRGKFKSLTAQQKGWLRRRQAVEPAIGHSKSDPRMDRCCLQGAMGDALHAISCATGYNLRWLLRALARVGIEAFILRLLQASASGSRVTGSSYLAQGQSLARCLGDCLGKTIGGGKLILAVPRVALPCA